MTAQRGLLISVEGCDRSGKTTQCQLLIDWLRHQFNMDCEGIKFPDRTTIIGKIINEYLTGRAQLNDQTIHLLYSANRWELKKRIEELLREGTTVILDRYAESGVAYSAAKGLDFDWCRAPDHGLPKSDIVIFIDVPIERTAGRNGYGEEKYEKVDFQKKVRSQFELLKDHTWVFIDGTDSIEEVTTSIQKAIFTKIDSLNRHIGPLDYLNWK